MSWDTTWKGLGEPRPRPDPESYVEHVWSSQPPHLLETAVSTGTLLGDLTTRQSMRRFGAIDPRDLSALLWSVAGCKQSVDSPMGFALERRGAPSAGAIHPVHILICDPLTRALHRYDGQAHALESLACAAPKPMLEMFTAILPFDAATLLLFVAEPGKTAAKYSDPISLVLRDAGVLQGLMAFAAEALKLNFCLLGATGDPWIAQLSQEGKLRGVGAALVGSRA